MEIQNLSDDELLSRVQDLVKQEKTVVLLLLDHLLEVEARKLYATLGYESHFKYLVKELGYAEATAYERLRVIRLLQALPGARDRIERGELSLATVAQAESFRKQHGLSLEQTEAILDEITGMSRRETEVHLLSKTPGQIPRESIRQVTATHQEARIILSPELQVLIARYQEIHGAQPLSSILETLLRDHIERRDPVRKAERVTMPAAKRRVNPGASRYVDAQTESRLWSRSEGRCEWRHPRTGERCESRYRLQMDHYPVPFARGGPSTFENLRLVCRAHNARFAVEVFGKQAISAG